MSHVKSKCAKRSKDSHGCCRMVSQDTGAGWGMSWREKHRCRDPTSVFIIYNSMNGEATILTLENKESTRTNNTGDLELHDDRNTRFGIPW